MTRFEASILVAARDEEATIEACVRGVVAVATGPWEVLVVDGGTDRTGEVVRALARELDGIRHVRNDGDRGKGHAIRRGILEARADVMAQFDADLQFHPEDLPRVLEPIRSGVADVVLGSRFLDGSVREPGSTPLVRRLGNHAVSAYASLVARRRLTDVQAGIKAWTREAAERIDLQSDNYSYEAEIPVKAVRRGLRVIEVPVTTRARLAGRSKVHVARAGLALFRDITRFAMAGEGRR